MPPQHLDPYDVVSWRVAMIFLAAALLLVAKILYRAYCAGTWRLKKALGVRSVESAARRAQDHAEIYRALREIVTHPNVQSQVQHWS